MRVYTLSDISRKITNACPGIIVTEDTVLTWVKRDGLVAERLPDYVQSWGKHPYGVKESELKAFLKSKGKNVVFSLCIGYFLRYVQHIRITHKDD